MPIDVVDHIVEENLGVYRASQSRLQEDVSQEAQVANDYRGRLVFELLQNADDAMEHEDRATAGDFHDDRIEFLITDDALWVSNTGRTLTDADVKGLCGLGASSKIDASGTKRASIGHKGLGFKSVLEITDQPVVYSRTHSFRLGEAEARPHVDALFAELGYEGPRNVPAMRFPVRIDSGDDEGRWSDLREEGFNTSFRFPFRSDVNGERRDALATGLLELPLTTILLLKHLERVVIRSERAGIEDTREWTIMREQFVDSHWVPVSGLSATGVYRILVVSDDGEGATFLVAHNADLEIGEHRRGLSGPAWQGVELTEVSIAVPEELDAGDMPAEWRRFHVFLPTAEICAYPMIVNGAFATDLSRKRVQVSGEEDDYNAHLVRSAAQLFVHALIPRLQEGGVESVLRALDRGEDPDESDATNYFHACLVDQLTEVPLIPVATNELAVLPRCVLPASILGAGGVDYRTLTSDTAEVDGSRLPTANLCEGRWARICGDHGARELTPGESLAVLAFNLESDRAKGHRLPDSDLVDDPVLAICEQLWEQSGHAERPELRKVAREVAIFPTQCSPDGTIERVAIGELTPFYPPQSAQRELPLRALHFMSHAVCWGRLNRNERNSVLGERMRTWSALFDIREFRFQEVMQAAVLPALVQNPSDELVEWRKELSAFDPLAAICQLAGPFAKPNSPLRYQRLRSDRAIFNLSRLPVPCIGKADDVEWVPAYRAYFGAAWIGERSVEHLLEHTLHGDRAEDFSDVRFIVPPDQLLGLLDGHMESEDSDDVGEQTATDLADDEVGVDEDPDAAIAADERERWSNFLAWLGVNESLRLVHFHDVEDENAGWLSTKNLQRPRGWAFAGLGEVWTTYVAEVGRGLGARANSGDTTPYFYEVHDLDLAGPILSIAASEPSAELGRRLLEHLVYHWPTMSGFARAEVALVESDKSPGQRTAPPRAKPDELKHVGDNLWVHRLKMSKWCPTTHGPRQPYTAWRDTPEVDRRFGTGRGGRKAGDLLPVLDVGKELDRANLRMLCDRIGVRGELSPSTFGIDDARLVCDRLKEIYADIAVEATTLRNVIRPTYRAMLELLTGRSGQGELDGELSNVPLLAQTESGLKFLPAREVLYAKTPGLAERSGLRGKAPLFVLEADPTATAPLLGIFGCAALEDELTWNPDPGDPALGDDELEHFRAELTSLDTDLLARIRVERTNATDLKTLRQLLERIEPVNELGMSVELKGQLLDKVENRPYFVQQRVDEPLQAFVVWDGPAWPPTPPAARALSMALADALGLNLVETFLAFVTKDPSERAELLRIAGASGHVDEARLDLKALSTAGAGGEGDDVPIEPASPPKTAEPSPPPSEQAAPFGPGTAPAAPPIPLYDFEDLTIGGMPLTVRGEQFRGHDGSKDSAPGGGRGISPGPKGVRAAPGTDLKSLDDLGMQIAAAYEVLRLTKSISDSPVDCLPFPDPDGDSSATTLVVDVHTPSTIAEAEKQSAVVREVMSHLQSLGISRTHPGFDLLTIRHGEFDRLIELKSSGVDARVQAMSWNEWKTASSLVRSSFWLYVVGNLRSDLANGVPYVRAIRDPFGSLNGTQEDDVQRRRTVQLRVREFEQAEHLDLGVRQV
jgi:hypothetical protein